MTKDTGGPAFPLINRDYQEAYGGCPGMTLRDWFAGQALAGLMSACDEGGSWTATGLATVNAARSAYEAADAMLAARQS